MIGPTTDGVAVKIEAARDAAAERMRRCRARRRAGYRCVLIEISNNGIGGLVRSGLLPADDSEDLDAIQTAVYDFFEQTHKGLAFNLLLDTLGTRMSARWDFSEGTDRRLTG